MRAGPLPTQSSRHYFLGGINSLRGWQFGQVGPLDSQGIVIGGNKYVVMQCGASFSAVEKYGVRGLVFFDTGNVFAPTQAISFSEFREDVGPGIRWNSPFGPLRIEIGWILDKHTNENPYQWQFSAGAFF